MFLESGTRLGAYSVTGLIGVGGMGEVYKAIDTRLDRTVAIKILPARVASDTEFRRRFEREAKAISSLNHPHICTLYDVGAQDGVEFLVMEYLEGKTLEELLAAGALALEDALRYAVEMTDALEAAHARGIVHRDFKPGNVTVTPNGSVKLLDFGVAKILAGLDVGARSRSAQTTVSGTVIGTASYMSPEQARGMEVDHRTDIWAFGCALFEMLTGQKAFAGQSAADTTAAILEREPELEALPASVPEAARRVIRRCLEKDLGRRLASIGEARGELERALAVLGSTSRKQQPSIAVLPFANMSADLENEYFSDGLAEEILNALTQIPGLKVIARTSAFSFKGKNEDIRRIAETLNVTTVLEGSVRKAGNRIRVMAQLIEGADGTHLWSKRYDRELADIFAVQDEIAEAIAATLRVTLGAQASEPRRPTTNVAAYDALLKADYYWRKATPEASRRSTELLEQALALDPTFALAHCALGRNLFFRYVAHLIPAHDAAPLIRKHLQNALSLDPALPEGHCLMSCLAAMYDYDWSEADRRFRSALEGGAVSVDVRWQLVNFFLAHAGRGAEALEYLSRARAEDPLNANVLWTLAVSLRATGRDADADALYEDLVDMDEGYISSISAVVLSGNHLARGAVTEALAFAEIAHAHFPQMPWTIGQLAGALLRAGETERARALTDQLQPGTAFGAPFGLALAAIGARDLDRASDWLERAIEQRDLWVSFLLNVGNIGGRVIWESLRWPGLAKLMNVPARHER